jgi:hypothetical protein
LTVRRVLRSTRGRLVLFQVLILSVAASVSAYAIYQLVSQPLVSASDGVLYGQWSTVAGGLVLKEDGSVAYNAGELPGAYGDPPTTVETVVFAKDGQVLAQSVKQAMPAQALLAQAQPVLNGGGPAYFDSRDERDGTPLRGYADLVQVGEQPNQVPVLVTVTKSTADLQATLERLLLTLIAGAALVVLVGRHDEQQNGAHNRQDDQGGEDRERHSAPAHRHK